MPWPCSWSNTDINWMKATLLKILDNQDQLNRRLTKQEKNTMSALEDLQAQVRQNTDLEQSAVSAIKGIAEQLRVALTNDDTAALQLLSQQLDSSAEALASAISANTAPQVNPQSARR